jgi:hypothetical protein
MKAYHPDPRRSPPVCYLGGPGAPGYAVSEGRMDPQEGVQTQLGREFLTPPWDPSVPLTIVAETLPPDRADPAIWLVRAEPPETCSLKWVVRVVHEQPPRDARRPVYIDEIKVNFEVDRQGKPILNQLTVNGVNTLDGSEHAAHKFRCRITVFGVFGVFGRFDAGPD